jgi:hypothetical protein
VTVGLPDFGSSLPSSMRFSPVGVPTHTTSASASLASAPIVSLDRPSALPMWVIAPDARSIRLSPPLAVPTQTSPRRSVWRLVMLASEIRRSTWSSRA